VVEHRVEAERGEVVGQAADVVCSKQKLAFGLGSRFADRTD